MALKSNTVKARIISEQICSPACTMRQTVTTTSLSSSDEWVDPTAIPDDDVADILPLSHDGLDLIAIAR